jgi:3,4-dihydroxy 2-butanone 4-phosphate synthase/GTP cyclohydrolase II
MSNIFDPIKSQLVVHREACASIPTEFGDYQLCLYTNNRDNKEHLAMIKGNVIGKENLPVRVHSECFTGDVMGSMRCDCGEQLNESMQMIAHYGVGMVIYLRQEGRGIGLAQKLLAYNLQDQGYDTVDANLALGHQADEREYSIVPLILNDWEIKSIKLITNNPHKIDSLTALGVNVVERIAIEIPSNPDNINYLKTKANRMNHQLSIIEQPLAKIA